MVAASIFRACIKMSFGISYGKTLFMFMSTVEVRPTLAQEVNGLLMVDDSPVADAPFAVSTPVISSILFDLICSFFVTQNTTC